MTTGLPIRKSISQLNAAMARKRHPVDNALDSAGFLPSPDSQSEDELLGEVLDENTTLDVIVSPTGYVVELSDTVDSLDDATTEVIDIVSEADGTNIELTIIKESTDKPGVTSVDRFIEIKGIGPKVAEILVQAGIRQFSQLAETPIERIREILSGAGSHYRIYDPATWPQQAKQLVDSRPNFPVIGQA